MNHYKAPITLGKTVYCFQCGVLDNRTGFITSVTVDANSKASAGKLLKVMGYTVRDMSFY